MSIRFSDKYCDSESNVNMYFLITQIKDRLNAHGFTVSNNRLFSMADCLDAQGYSDIDDVSDYDFMHAMFDSLDMSF